MILCSIIWYVIIHIQNDYTLRFKACLQISSCIIMQYFNVCNRHSIRILNVITSKILIDFNVQITQQELD